MYDGLIFKTNPHGQGWAPGEARHCVWEVGEDTEWIFNKKVRCWWLTPIILAAQEAETGRIVIRSQHQQIVRETLSRKTRYKNRAGGEA
jgi:hypothetical protein